ncbi:MAG: ABC transporter ATP-binding protein [Bacteroidaceae bacterium]|nr:ABC transporter ATP-binding protein [Bacteroidaceae bacterium]
MKNITNNIPLKQLLGWLWKNSKGARGQATLNTIIGLLDVACQLLWVLACKRAIDIATGECEGSIAVTGCVIGTLMLVEILSRATSRWIHAVIGSEVRNKMRLKIFSRLLRGEWLHLQKHHTGDLINRLEGDVNNITALITETIPAVIVVSVQLLASFILLFSMSHMLAVSVLVALPLAMFASRFYIKKMRKLNRDVRDSDSRIQAVLQESLQHKALIKALEQNESTEQQLTNLQEQLQGQVRNRTKFSLGAYSLTQLGFASGYLIAFIWGVQGLATGAVSFGTLSAYLQLVGLIQRPTMDMSRFIPSIVLSFTATERLCELEDIPEEKQGESVMLQGTAGVRFKDVSFRYEKESRMILNNFNYDFAPNSSTAIIGETGAGKTTLIRLLVALITPQEGKVEIYNENEKHCSSTTTRCNFVYIPQGNSLISGTIRDNLLMGNPNATEEEIMRALHIACADYVMELPQGIDTELAEQGGGLSEGQAQRIAVARSILRPGSILILDEVTSALDEETEQEMLHRLTNSQIGKTLIFVTHRPAIMQYCDKVLRIEKPQKKIC